MLHLLDDALEGFLRSVVPLSAREVDIAFDAPDREWAAQVSRPTINLFLWDVRPSLAERDVGLRVVSHESGRTTREGPRPRVDCRYLITVWASHVENEHDLLGQVLAALQLNPTISPEFLKPPLAGVEPLPAVTLRTGGDTDSSDFWSAIGGQLKPGLDVAITVTLDAAAILAAGPPVAGVVVRTKQPDAAAPTGSDRGTGT